MKKKGIFTFALYGGGGFDTACLSCCICARFGGRNAVMIHSPDMGNVGKANSKCGLFTAENSTLATSRKLKSTQDYAAYGEAVGAYVDYVSGVDILVKSTSADITLDNVTFETFNGVVLMTALNSDDSGNYLHEETDGAEIEPIAVSMKNMKVKGDIKHMDYQRIMTLSIENTTLKGAVPVRWRTKTASGANTGRRSAPGWWTRSGTPSTA